jgi:hypothetical protein
MLRTLTAVSLALSAAALAACSSNRPTHVVRRAGLGGSSLVFVEALDTSKVSTVGRFVPATPGEIASRFRTRLLQELREQGMQTRDADGVPREGILVRGTIDTIDGGTTDGVKVGGQRLHCTIELFNCDDDRSNPAAVLRVTGTPGVTEVVTESGGILGAAEDAADQVAKYVKQNP